MASAGVEPAASPVAPAAGSPRLGPGVWLALLLALGLMLPGIADPYGGFLAYSEAWYTLGAKSLGWHSLLRPEVAPGRPDFNLPPLFAWLLRLGFVPFGPGEAAARLVAIAGALLAVAALGRRAGPAAALLCASSPAFVLLGRNVQPDGWALGLALAAWAAWRPGGPILLPAVLFGLALLAKPTVLLLPAFLLADATIARRGLGWVSRRHLGWAAIAALFPAAWAALCLGLYGPAFLAGLRHGEGAFEPFQPGMTFTLASEVVFAFFPVLAIAAPLAATRFGREPGIRPAATVLGLGIVLFAVMHYHGYYLVAWLPAAAILAGRLLAGRQRLLAALVGLNALASLVVLGGHKLGRAEVARLARQTVGTTWLTPPAVWQGYWTLIQLYAEPRAILSGGCATASAAGPVVVLPARPGAPAPMVVGDGPRALVVAGWGLAELPPNPHRLAWGPLTIVRRPGVTLGFARLDDPPSLGLEQLLPGVTACLPADPG